MLISTDTTENDIRLIRTLLEDIEDYAVFTLNTSGLIQSWNKGAEKIKGYTYSEIVHKNFEVFYPAESRLSGLPQYLLESAAQNGKIYHEGWRVRKNGTLFWAAITITAMHDDDGKICGYCKITRDLTERKNSELAIQAKVEELRQKNNNLENFAYTVSHDLQEPLNTSIALIDMLTCGEAGNLNKIVQTYLEVLGQSAARMKELIRGVLDYSKIGLVPDWHELECMGLLNVVKSDLGESIRRAEATLLFDGLPKIVASPIGLRQLFQNLIGNAIKFRDPLRRPIVEISCIEQDSEWQFMVKDNGIGIDLKHNSKIFELFQRLHTSSEYEGTGIGLANCKKIVESHGGNIFVNSIPGHGSVFTFTISKFNLSQSLI